MKTARHKVITALLLTVMGGGFAADNARAFDQEFYSSNDVLFTNPNECIASGGSGGGVPDVASTESEDKNAEIIFKFLISTNFSGLGGKPFNAVQAAGALGNFYQESRFDPGAIENGREGSAIGDGHGLAQWSYNVSGGRRVGPGRRGILMDLAQSEGRKWSDMGLQLKMIENELNQSYGKSLLRAGFGTVSDPKQASYIFQKIYESAGVPSQSIRDGAAVKYHGKFKDMAPGVVTAGETSSGCAAPASASNFSDDGFVVYDQCDPRWANTPYSYKTACSSGCGPTAMAAAITALTGKAVTPDQTVKYASDQGMYIAGAGSSHQVPVVVAKRWNINAKSVPMTVASINKVLKDGGLVIISGIGPAPFTSAGHYILIRAVTADGKWKVADSNGSKGQANSKKEWDPRGILTSAAPSSVYALTK